MENSRKALFQLHLAVLLFGVSGLFGKLVPLDAAQIVFGRTLTGCVALLAFASFQVFVTLLEPIFLKNECA